MGILTGDVGINETKEALHGVNTVGVFLAGRLRDGAQYEDFEAFLQALKDDPEFKAVLEKAWTGAGGIPEEMRDLTMVEGGELVVIQASYVPQYIAALRGE